jgi:hypothetical protein
MALVPLGKNDFLIMSDHSPYLTNSEMIINLIIL